MDDAVRAVRRRALAGAPVELLAGMVAACDVCSLRAGEIADCFSAFNRPEHQKSREDDECEGDADGCHGCYLLGNNTVVV